MKKKKINPFLSKQYIRLEKQETKTRRKLNKLYIAYNAILEHIILDMFHFCIRDSYVDYSKLLNPITKSESIELEHETAQVKKQLAHKIDEYPFTITNFDKLNKLDSLTVRIILNQLELANEEIKIIKNHLKRYCDDLLLHLEEYLDLYDMEKAAAIVAYVVQNEPDPRMVIHSNYHYSIPKTVIKNNYHIATQIADKVKKDIIRKEEPKKSVKTIIDYAERQDRGSTEKVLYTEGTRTTIESVSEYIADYVEYFRTVSTKDEKVCLDCRTIDFVQKYQPVPIARMVIGMNAPPFHPYCRCKIEVIWLDGEGEKVEKDD